MRHSDAQPLFRRDEMIEILRILAGVDLDPVHLAAELVAPRPVVRAGGRARLKANVTGLVGGEDHRLGLLYAALADCLAIHVQRDHASLGEPATVVLKFHSYLVRSRWDF